MEKSVAHLFGSEAKVKIMRLFAFNPSLALGIAEVAKRAKVRSNIARRELSTLIKTDLVKKRGKNFSLNRDYRYLGAISNFLTSATPLSEKELVKKLSPAGSVKLILISGVLMHVPDSRVDILVVGDNMKEGKLLSIMSSIEAELGRELRYAVFETSDFQYRLGIYDKLVRDILESEHSKILNKLGLRPPMEPISGYPQA